MKKSTKWFAMAFSALIAFSACDSDDSDFSGGPKVTDEAMDAVIATYVDKVILPTYQDMENKVGALKNSVDRFLADGTQANLDAACAAWRAAREPWELSEAFLYGPADSKGLDPNLDSWPLDKNGIDQILASQDFEQIKTDNKNDDDIEQAQSLRGFHTIEYLLFDSGEPRVAANITTNEKNYMSIVAQLLLSDTQTLHKAWKEGLGADDEDVPNAFGDVLKNHNSNIFMSAANVISTIIDDGCINIIGDVGEQKIGEPYMLWKQGDKEGGLFAVESWYSWNSREDYMNNIISVENSYMGGIRTDRDEATSLSSLIKSVDAELDAEIKAQIDATIKAIENIPHPFRNNLDKNADIDAAMQACSDLEDVLNKIKGALGID